MIWIAVNCSEGIPKRSRKTLEEHIADHLTVGAGGVAQGSEFRGVLPLKPQIEKRTYGLDLDCRQRLSGETSEHADGHDEPCDFGEIPAQVRAHCFFSARVAESKVLDQLRGVSDAYSRGEIDLATARMKFKKWYDREKAGSAL